jgi:tetratricopeptide (TPR) repeat protein/CHAT domain-containing protein
MSVLCAAIVWLLAGGPQSQTQPDEAAVRALVQQYFDAEAQKDADKALSFWSAAAITRPTRDAFALVFGPGDDQYTVDIRSVAIKGDEARVRVAALLVRTIMRNGVPVASRQTLLNAQLWRREGTTWKLLRDGPWAEDFADELLAAAPQDRPRMLADNPGELNASLRYVLAQRASVAAVAHNYQRARVLFELALGVARAAHDQRGESEMLQNVANSYYFLRDYPTASDYYQQRLTLARTMGDDDAIAASMLGLASVEYSRGEYTTALVSYREALAIYEKRDDGTSIGRTLVSVGNVQYLEADYDAATASYKRALSLLLAGMDLQGAAFARSGLARVLVAQGDLGAGLDMYGQVLAEARARTGADPRSNAVATALESIGDVYFRLGNTDQARSSFEEARGLSTADPDAAGRLSGELGLTELIAGRFDAALAAYTESRGRYEMAREPGGVARAWVGIGFSQAAREKFADAITAYRAAIGMFEQQKHEEEAGRAWLGLSLAQSGAADHAAALESARKVTAIADRVKSDDLTWRGGVRAGEALRKLARLDEARAAFEAAIASIDRLAAEAPINPDARAELDDSASAWAGLAFTLAKQGDGAGALNAAEARRAHLRRVALAAFQQDVTRGETPEEQADEQSLVHEIISTRAQLRAERDMPKPEAARVEHLGQQLTALRARRADQQARLYARLPELQAWRALKPEPPDVSAILTDPAALVVEYLVGDDEILVLAAERGESGPRLTSAIVAVRRHDLADKIAQAMDASSLQDAAEWQAHSAPLATILLAPLAGALRDRERCIIVPDDLLWKVPFEALPYGDEDLASRMRVTYATSLATLAIQRRLPPPASSPAAAIVAAPAIPGPVHAQLLLTQPGWKEVDGAALVTAAKEVAGLYKERSSLQTGPDAAESSLRASLQTADVAHVAAPFHVSGPAPLFSSIVLAGSGESAVNDGRWEAREWFSLEGRARVLVIPDASAFGAAGIGGAMDVLAWAAASAGVSALVLGRWPVDAFSVDAVALAFHSQLAAGTPPADAWRAAVLAARGKASAPAGWAGLRFVGGG